MNIQIYEHSLNTNLQNGHQAPYNGFCESVLFWHTQQAHYGDINLDDLTLVNLALLADRVQRFHKELGDQFAADPRCSQKR